MDAFFVRAADFLGGKVPPDHLKLAACILSTYPNALLFRRFPANNATLKHAFSIVSTTFIMLPVLQSYIGFTHIMLTCLSTYLLMKYYHGAHGPWINFVLTMTSMSIWYVDRWYNTL